MAAYPTFNWQRDGSEIARDGGINPVRATNGLLKVRRLYSADKANFTAVHWLSDSQRATLDAHYAANRAASFSVTVPDDGASYTVVYGAAPQYKRMDGFSVATVQLLEV